MSRCRCPACHEVVALEALLPHPPDQPNASRALSQSYCPRCGVALRVQYAWRWYHAVLLAIPMLLTWFWFDTWPGAAQIDGFSDALPFVGVVMAYWLIRRSRQLVRVN